MQKNNYSLLLKKLDEFVRKYYVNQTIRGFILFFALAIALFLSIVFLEYFGQFSSLVRTGLFYGFTSLLFIVFALLIAKPTLKLLSIGKKISHKEASTIIGKHFNEVNDKLVNILQLKIQENNGSSDLILASIDQKISELSPIPFGVAINFKENRRYLKYLVVPVIIIVGLAAFEPKIIKDSSNRIIAHNQDFIPTAPYLITIENKELTAYKNEDFNLRVKLVGEEIPNKLNIIFMGNRFLMKKNKKNEFSHAFKNIQSDIDFTLFDGEFESQLYELKTLPKPLLVNFLVDFSFPKYLNKKDISLTNTGDFTVPEGTSVKWTFRTENTDKVLFIQANSSVSLARSGENEYLFSNRFYNTTKYGLSTANQYLEHEDTIFYTLDVIPDLRPNIEVDTKVDSLNPKMRYFKGYVKDDYGFSRLTFYSQYIGINDSVGELTRQDIPINVNVPQTDFYHLLNTDQYALKAGDEIEYFFEVWDNDGVKGSKSSRTQKIRYKAPTKEELNEKNKKNSEEVKKELEESIELTKEIKKEIDALSEKLLNKKELGFQEKKQLQSLIDKQKKVQKSLDKLKSKNEKNNKLQEEFSPEDEALLEKQGQLQELFEKVMTDEMKEMMKKMEEMMDHLKKDDLQKALEEMELNNKELEKELDRNLELFKQLELEKQLADAKEKLDELIEEQKKLKEESQDKNLMLKKQKRNKMN
ncbi:MAG: hypothetical protein JKY48_03475 [Flavobacteriales bacterium]|nr:hypothetical protein [Flavobacteriales bacterium]